MRKSIWIGALIATAAVLGGATLAHAGYGWPAGGVFVNRNADGTGYASGNLRVTRQSPDTVQYIGCTIFSDRLGQRLSCSAQPTSGAGVTCISTDANLIRTAAALQPDSQLGFTFDRTGTCTGVNVTMSSLTLH